MPVAEALDLRPHFPALIHAFVLLVVSAVEYTAEGDSPCRSADICTMPPVRRSGGVFCIQKGASVQMDRGPFLWLAAGAYCSGRRRNSTPSVPGPQWEDTVQPACVTNTSLKGASSCTSAVSWRSVSSGTSPEWVRKA